jgi:uncharacterized protein YjbI with pentapeptide repeats
MPGIRRLFEPIQGYMSRLRGEAAGSGHQSEEEQAGVGASGAERPSDSHLSRLVQSIQADNACESWNRWRTENPETSVVLQSANLAGLNISHADLRKADLRGADFRAASLNKTKFGASNLRAACFDRAHVRASDFHLANLNFATFINASCHDVSFNHCPMARTSFRNARLARARFIESNAQSADFVNATLIKTDFKGAKLELADFRGVEMAEANFRDADLRSVRMASAGILRAIVYRCGLRGVSRPTRLAQIETRDATVEPVELRYIQDHNYLHSFRKRHRILFHLWNVSTRCGQSLGRWAFLSVLLIALFGFVYSRPTVPAWVVVAGLNPDAITPVIDFSRFASGDDRARAFAPYYFSVVTFATLGYGDVTPLNFPGQLIVCCEVVLGYVMLGGLISIFTEKLVRRS